MDTKHRQSVTLALEGNCNVIDWENVTGNADMAIMAS